MVKGYYRNRLNRAGSGRQRAVSADSRQLCTVQEVELHTTAANVEAGC